MKYKMRVKTIVEFYLPDIEEVSALVHDAWMERKRNQGIFSRKSENGEEFMVPYKELSDEAKELDRATVRAVYEAMAQINEDEFIGRD